MLTDEQLEILQRTKLRIENPKIGLSVCQFVNPTGSSCYKCLLKELSGGKLNYCTANSMLKKINELLDNHIDSLLLGEDDGC